MVISQKSGHTQVSFCRYSPRADCFLRTNFHSSYSIGRLFQGFKTRDIKYLKHVPESKTLLRNTCFGFWEVFLDSGTCFWILGSVLDSGTCFGFWEVFLDSRKCFGFWDVFLDSGKCFGF